MVGPARLVVGVILVLCGLALFLATIVFPVGLVLMVVGLIFVYSWASAARSTEEGTISRIWTTWSKDRAGRGLDLLRILLGLIWTTNLVFIFLPSADYWATFPSVAASYASTSLFGPQLANFMAANPTFFAWLIAIGSAYLAVAFLLGITTRLACLAGFIGSVVFLLTQWNSTFVFPGGTDVGAHPLYLAIYTALLVGGAGRYWSLDAWVWRTGRARLAKFSEWIATPPPGI